MKNSELPAQPTYPTQDTLGRIIVFSGLTKREYVAMHLLNKYSIEDAYNLADLFLDQEEKKEFKSEIIFWIFKDHNFLRSAGGSCMVNNWSILYYKKSRQ